MLVIRGDILDPAITRHHPMVLQAVRAPENSAFVDFFLSRRGIQEAIVVCEMHATMDPSLPK